MRMLVRQATLVAAVGSLLRPEPVRAQATNPPYIAQMPTVERVMADVQGTDPRDTAAKQMGAFWQLQQVIEELAGDRRWRNQLTADESRILSQYRHGYVLAQKPYHHIETDPSHPDKAAWFQQHGFYETDDRFLDALLRHYFPSDFHTAYYAATGKRPPATRLALAAPAAAAPTSSVQPQAESTPTDQALPAAAPPGPLQFASVSAGHEYSCGVTTTGGAYCWGDNSDGQLGDGTNTASNVPVSVGGGHIFASVSAGSRHSCGVTTAGEAYCWGDNSDGQLGDGTNANTRVPVAVTGGHSFISVSAGSGYTCGVTKSGAALCWGSNSWEVWEDVVDSGRLGNGTTADSAVPVAVVGGITFTSLSTGETHSCGVTAAGAAYCWGDNGEGQLGGGAEASSSAVPVAVSASQSFTMVSAGSDLSCGVTDTGAAYCWGARALGNGSRGSSDIPVAVSGGLTFASVSPGQWHSCGVTKAGAAYCWGGNAGGKLGHGRTSESGGPDPGSEVPVAVSGGLTFASLSVGDEHSCAVTTTAAAYCWGFNGKGELGDGTNIARNVPVAVGGP